MVFASTSKIPPQRLLALLYLFKGFNCYHLGSKFWAAKVEIIWRTKKGKIYGGSILPFWMYY
jgi:hypothetical protein